MASSTSLLPSTISPITSSSASNSRSASTLLGLTGMV